MLLTHIRNPRSPWMWQVASGGIYSLFVFAIPALGGTTALGWVFTAISFALFAWLYADFFLRGGRSTRRQVDLLLIAIMGLALLPFNVGGTTYVAYAAALAPFSLRPRQSIALLVVLAGALWTVMWLIAHPDWIVVSSWVTSVIFIVGLGNLFISDHLRQAAVVRRAQEDVEEMAKVAERERIARDLHDVLGHTLSVIAMKSELASKLADRDPVRAVREIREVERISRAALTEVRAAVEGYKNRGFSGELSEARQTLASAGVRLDADIGDVPLLPRQETALALALRETITNVVRHARASVCRVALVLDRGEVVLTVQDDGTGGPLREGNGLTGMRERVVAAGGTLNVDAAHGVTIRVGFPASTTA
ncbi:MAG TPA: sensor histidine kinase [Vicinamibacterales bacterium]|nr:sensor histidine kinase [Vicinamibacterales bacterium]